MCPAKLGGPNTLSRRTVPNLDCAFLESVLVLIDPNIGSPGSACPLPDLIEEKIETSRFSVLLDFEAHLFIYVYRILF